MGSKKTESSSRQETRTDLRPRTAQEQQMLDLLTRQAQSAGSQIDLDAIGQLASGEGLQATDADRQLVEENFGLTNDLATRALEDFVRQANLGLDESLSARGIQGSSIESVNRGLVNRDATRQLANILDQQSMRSNDQLMQLPFQRAGMQLNANQALFNQLLGGATNAATFGLNERIADIDTQGWGTGTQTTPYSFIDYMNAGANVVGAFNPPKP